MAKKKRKRFCPEDGSKMRHLTHAHVVFEPPIGACHVELYACSAHPDGSHLWAHVKAPLESGGELPVGMVAIDLAMN